jgi:hypothetical protein
MHPGGSVFREPHRFNFQEPLTARARVHRLRVQGSASPARGGAGSPPGCDVGVPRFATVDLTGQVVDEVCSRGKRLFIRVGPASVHSHLKMDGSWRWETVRGGWITGRESFWRPTIFARSASTWACWRSSTAPTTARWSHTWDLICWATTGTDRRGAAGPAGAGRDWQCLLQRIVFRQRTPVHRAGERGHRSAPAGVSRPRHVVGQPLPLESSAPPATRGRAGNCGFTGEPGRVAVAAARPSTVTTAVSGWRTGARSANADGAGRDRQVNDRPPGHRPRQAFRKSCRGMR